MTGPSTLLDRLRSSHSATRNDFALEIWATFASTVVAAVNEAGRRMATPAVRADLVQRRGWWNRARRVNPSGVEVRVPAEDSITDALVEQLERLRVEAAADDPLVSLNIAFASQQPRRRQRRIGPAALTTDIRAHVPDNRDLDLRIEAKVLFQAGDIRSQYLGERGLLRFADARNPYTDAPVGAMLGFMVTPCERLWTELIHGGLDAVPEALSPARVAVVPGTHPISVCDVARGTERERVTVMHLELTQETDPSSWVSGEGRSHANGDGRQVAILDEMKEVEKARDG